MKSGRKKGKELFQVKATTVTVLGQCEVRREFT